MRASDVIGKKIVSVEHERWWNRHLYKHEVTVTRIFLEDGSELRPWCFETLDQPAATINFIKGESEK